MFGKFLILKQDCNNASHFEEEIVLQLRNGFDDVVYT